MNNFRQILVKYWGYSGFRPLQEEIIMSVAAGNDTLGLLATGGGKSITFQVYSLSREGICVVITPLIALMKDQVENLKKRNIKAMAIYSGLSKDEIDIALENCIYGDFKFLYLSPERLGTEIFRTRVVNMNVNLIVVDEAHCISQWGYDFRPSYMKIPELRKLLPDVPVLALTATATPEVVDDIQDRLSFKKRNALKISFERKNLTYVVRNVEDKLKYLVNILSKVQGTGIVYVRSRGKTKEIAEFLLKNNISADYYHAGLDNEVRSAKQDQWKSGKVRVIVSTNAFGMGIDKPDVRVVVHIDLPDSLEAYFQEAGRAGRDEKKAYAVLLYNESDKKRLERFEEESFPELERIKQIYNALGNYYQVPIGGGKGQSFDFNIFDFCKHYSMQSVLVLNCMKILQSNGYIEVTDEVHNPSRVHFIVNRDDLYKFQVANLQFDNFIKLLLRTYSGLFSDYVSISELALATKAKVPVETIFGYLQKLQSLHIIKYIPQKNTPSVVYIEERLDEKNLYISRESYQDKQARISKRVEAAIRYASSVTKCRSQILLGYFGDADPFRCGQCDVCVKRNSLDLSQYELDKILEQIKLHLHEHPKTIDELVSKLAFDEQKIIKSVQWLLENQKLRYNDEQKLTWHSSGK